MHLLKDQHNLNFEQNSNLDILKINRIDECMKISLSDNNIVKLIMTACFVGLIIC
jgi:hypothetical protein